TGGKDATESPGVPGRRRVVERCAADQVYACRRGVGLRLADPDADGIERRVHALPADGQAEAGGGADQGAGRLRFEEARNQPAEVSGRTGGMAAALLAMNEVFGRFFDVRPIDMFESEAFAASGPPQNLFVLDDQTHMVRFTQTQGRSLRAIAQGPGPASTAAGFLRNPNNSTGALDELGNAWTPWNPLLGQTPNTGSEFHLAKYIQRFFLESQVTVSILSNANLGSIPVAGEPNANRPPKNIAESLGAENLTGHMTAGVRDFVNQIAGSTRMLAHGQLYPGVGNLHDPVYGDYTQWQIDTFHPDSWKGYNIATAAKLDFN